MFLWASPVSVETQNFASVHEESHHVAILQFYGSMFKDYFSMVHFINFTMQSIQMGRDVTSSMNTLAGCISSNAIRSDI